MVRPGNYGQSPILQVWHDIKTCTKTSSAVSELDLINSIWFSSLRSSWVLGHHKNLYYRSRLSEGSTLVVSTDASQQEGSGLKPLWPATCVFSLASFHRPKIHIWGLGDMKLTSGVKVTVNVFSCLWPVVQGVPHLSPEGSWDRLQPLAELKVWHHLKHDSNAKIQYDNLQNLSHHDKHHI